MRLVIRLRPLVKHIQVSVGHMLYTVHCTQRPLHSRDVIGSRCVLALRLFRVVVSGSLSGVVLLLRFSVCLVDSCLSLLMC